MLALLLLLLVESCDALDSFLRLLKERRREREGFRWSPTPSVLPAEDGFSTERKNRGRGISASLTSTSEKHVM